jgi:hypothetical protein
MSDSLAIAEIMRLREEIYNLRQNRDMNDLKVSDIRTPEEASDVIAKAIDTAHAAYWAACDTQGRAINPITLKVRERFLDEAFKKALMIEDTAQNLDITWYDARKLSDENLLQHKVSE